MTSNKLGNMSRTNQNTRSMNNLETAKAMGKESLASIEGIDEEPIDLNNSKYRKASNLSKIESRNSIHYKNKSGTYQ